MQTKPNRRGELNNKNDQESQITMEKSDPAIKRREIFPNPHQNKTSESDLAVLLAKNPFSSFLLFAYYWHYNKGGIVTREKDKSNRTILYITKSAISNDSEKLDFEVPSSSAQCPVIKVTDTGDKWRFEIHVAKFDTKEYYLAVKNLRGGPKSVTVSFDDDDEILKLVVEEKPADLSDDKTVETHITNLFQKYSVIQANMENDGAKKEKGSRTEAVTTVKEEHPKVKETEEPVKVRSTVVVP